MAIYHLHAQIIGRSSGRSAVAAAAYRSGTEITNEYDGVTHDYTRKSWIEMAEIRLPEYAPEAYRDRGTLWNAVEWEEKNANAQLAREIEVSLPIELDLQQQIGLVRRFVDENFVADGMCADIAIHNPPITDGHNHPLDQNGNPTTDVSKMMFRNPHAHIMLTMRPIAEDGSWQEKTQLSYVCRRAGQELAIPADKMPEAEKEGWKKQYRYWIGKKQVWMPAETGQKKGLKRVDRTPKRETILNPVVARWNSRANLQSYREAWERICNETFADLGLSERISCKSYEEQGIDRIASAHLGPYAYQMEKKGVQTELGELNRRIQKDNAFLRMTEQKIHSMEKKEKQELEQIAAKMEGCRAKCIFAAYQQLCLSAEVAEDAENTRKQMQMAEALAKATEEMMKGIQALTDVLELTEEQLKHTNPWQKKRKQELKDRIFDTEMEIGLLKAKMKETKFMYEAKMSYQEWSPERKELAEQQIRELKQKQTQNREEFYVLLKENRDNMDKLREMLRVKRPEYNQYIERKLKETYKDGFQIDSFVEAQKRAPHENAIPYAPSAHRRLQNRRTSL